MNISDMDFDVRIQFAANIRENSGASFDECCARCGLTPSPSVLRALSAQVHQHRIERHHDMAREIALIDRPGQFGSFSVTFVHLVEHVTLEDIEMVYAHMSESFASRREQIKHEALRSAVTILGNLRRVGWLIDDLTPDPDALQSRVASLECAYRDANAPDLIGQLRSGKTAHVRNPDPEQDPLETLMDWLDDEPDVPVARDPVEVREVTIHAAPIGAPPKGAPDELIRHEARKSLAGGKRLGSVLTRHQVDEIHSALYVEAPWLAPVIDWTWKRHLSVLDDPECAFRLPPVLVVGPPGSGKTHFMTRLAELLDLPFVRMDMSGVLEPWSVAGAAWGWRGAQSGVAVRAIQESGFANPLILLDEVEKSGRGPHGSPLNALLPLLQRETARTYRCPYLDSVVDLSRVSWILLGNSLDRIPAPLLDRVEIFRVRGPEGPEVRQLAQRLLGETAADHRVIDAVVEAFASGKMSLRGLHRLAGKFREIDNRPQFN